MTNLALERHRKGLKQIQAALELDVSPKTLCKYEKDPRLMPGDFIIRAAAFYGCDAGYLLGITEERNSYVAKTA